MGSYRKVRKLNGSRDRHSTAQCNPAFVERTRETTIGLKYEGVRKIEGKNIVFDQGKGNEFSFELSETGRKNAEAPLL